MSKTPESRPPEPGPQEPDEAEPRPAAASPRPAVSLVDSIVDIHVERPEPEVWALLDLAATKHKPPRFYPKSTPSNVHYVLSQDSRWLGRLRTNDFDGGLYLDGVPMSDVKLTEAVHWLERVYSLKTTEERVSRTAIVVGDEYRFHPVRDYLDRLKWDKNPRVGRLLTDYFGAAVAVEDGPSGKLLAELGRCFLVSCVARVYVPGCKVDTTLILVGKQGARKSSGLRVLAGEWFSDTLIDLHTKDLYESLQGVWIYELAELDAFRRAEWSKVKAILSSPTDRWRRPYGRSVEARARQVVFSGTTNQDHFLGDPTGSRRFHPVVVGTIRLDMLQADRDQLWAEAVAIYRAGGSWWLDDAMAVELAEVSKAFAEQHPWTEVVAEYVIGRSPTTAEILEHAIKKEAGKWTRADENELGAVMRSLGFIVRRQRDKYGRCLRVWTPGES